MEKIARQNRSERGNCERLAKLHQDRYAAFCIAAEKASRIPPEATRKEQEKIIEKSLRTKADFEKTEEEYKAAIERYNASLDLRDSKMREVCQSYQAMEEERLAEIKRTLQKIMDLQLELLGNFNQKVYIKMQECVDCINVQDDLNAFVRTSGTGQSRQKRWKMDALLEQTSKTVDDSIMNNLLYPPDSGSRMTMKRRSSVFGKKATMFMDKLFSNGNGTIKEAPVVQPARKLSSLFQTNQNTASPAKQTASTSNPQIVIQTTSSPPKPPVVAAENSGPVISPHRKPRNLEWMSKFAVSDETAAEPVSNAAPAVKFAPDTAEPKVEQAVKAAPISPARKEKVMEKQASLSTLSSKEDEREEVASSVSEDEHVAAPVVEPPKPKSSVVEKPHFKETPIAVVTKPSSPPTKSISLPSNAAPIAAPAPATVIVPPATSVAPVAKKDTNFSRRSIKMEGWLQVQEDSVSSIKRWGALEGGYIWFFESKEDNNKPQGANKPKSMISVTRAEITEDAENSCISILSNRKRVLLTVEDAQEYNMWLDILKSSTKFGK